MNLPNKICEGRFVKRYKRFFADVEINGKIETALVPNTGSLKTCLQTGWNCYLSVSTDPKRKLKLTLEMVSAPGSLVGVNTVLANKLVGEAWRDQTISHWQEFAFIKPEAKISEASRLDFVMWSENFRDNKFHRDWLNDKKFRGHFVEVKNVTMAIDGVALFPDSVTSRGQKHLQELVKLQRQGHSTEIVFVVQRTDCTRFAPADDIDPEYGNLLRKARLAGVRITALACQLSPTGIKLESSNLKLNF